jgi:hypothetical protein
VNDQRWIEVVLGVVQRQDYAIVSKKNVADFVYFPMQRGCSPSNVTRTTTTTMMMMVEEVKPTWVDTVKILDDDDDEDEDEDDDGENER